MTTRPTDAIRDAALKIIDRRAIPSSRLRERLCRRGFAQDDVNRVLESLTRAGVLNDEAFGLDVAERLLEKEPIGADALRIRLQSKGLEPDVITRICDRIYINRDEREDIERTARSIVARMGRNLATEVATRRLVAALARRGFDEDLSIATAERVIASQTDHAAQ